MTLFVFSACSDLDEINTNPDSTTEVPPEFLATKIILNLTYSASNKSILNDSWLMKSTQFTETATNEAYNTLGTYGFGAYRSVTDAKKMVEIAEADNTLSQAEINAYKGLLDFYKASKFYDATMRLGDVPASDAFKGEEGQYNVKYDTQEEVFGIIISLLDSSSAYFANAEEFNGDPVYNGNPELWERMVNSFQLRVLNVLSDKNTVGEINVKQKFEQLAQAKLIASGVGDFQRVYSESVSEQWYPFYREKQPYYIYPVMSSFMIDMLKKYNDYRIFYYADPAEELISNGEGSFDAYSGVDPVAPFSTVTNETSQGLHSPLNARYYDKADCEPIKFVAYSETQFILAEAALRGWSTPESANTHYENAVKAAMKFTNENTSEQYKHGVMIDDTYIVSYLMGSANLDNASSATDKLKLVMEQKYIASFVQLRWNSFFDYRRTGFPELPINPATNLNQDPNSMPDRWRYASSEYTENREFVEEAINRQFGGDDANNQLMWLLK